MQFHFFRIFFSLSRYHQFIQFEIISNWVKQETERRNFLLPNSHMILENKRRQTKLLSAFSVTIKNERWNCVIICVLFSHVTWYTLLTSFSCSFFFFVWSFRLMKSQNDYILRIQFDSIVALRYRWIFISFNTYFPVTIFVCLRIISIAYHFHSCDIFHLTIDETMTIKIASLEM